VNSKSFIIQKKKKKKQTCQSKKLVLGHYNKYIICTPQVGQYRRIFGSQLLYWPSLQSGQYCQPDPRFSCISRYIHGANPSYRGNIYTYPFPGVILRSCHLYSLQDGLQLKSNYNNNITGGPWPFSRHIIRMTVQISMWSATCPNSFVREVTP